VHNDAIKTLRPVRVIIPTTLSKDYEDESIKTISLFPLIDPITLSEDEECWDDLEDVDEIRVSPDDLNNLVSAILPRSYQPGSTVKNQSEPLVKEIPQKDISYLGVIMKQAFEGSWNPTDKEIQTAMLANGELSPAPKELGIDSAQAEKAWMTILVLLWLEVVHQKEKQAWRIIHQKGCEWLESLGINYEQVKDLGKSFIKA